MRLQIFHDTVVALSSINNGFFSPFPGTKTLIVIMISVRRIHCVIYGLKMLSMRVVHLGRVLDGSLSERGKG